MKTPSATGSERNRGMLFYPPRAGSRAKWKEKRIEWRVVELGEREAPQGGVSLYARCEQMRQGESTVAVAVSAVCEATIFTACVFGRLIRRPCDRVDEEIEYPLTL